MSILSAVMDGSAGASASTQLTAACDDDDVIISVTSTTGFLSSGGVLMLDGEKTSYTALTPLTFTGLTRGIEGTTAAAHAINTGVYNEDAGLINYAMGFNVVQTGVPGGIASVAMMPYNFLTKTVPRLVLWDYAFLQGDLVILRYGLSAISIGFVIYLSYMAVNTIIGVLSKVL